MKTLMIILVAIALVLLIVPGAYSLAKAVKAETGDKIDKSLPPDVIKEKARIEFQNEADSLKELYSETMASKDRLSVLEEKKKALSADKAKHLKYMKKADEILNSASSSSEKVLIGGKEFPRDEVKQDWRQRYGSCQRIDKDVNDIETGLMVKEKNLQSDLSSAYEMRKQSLLDRWSQIEEKIPVLKELEQREKAYEAINRARNSSAAFLSKEAPDSRYVRLLNEQIAQKQNSINMYRESASLDAELVKPDKLESAFEKEYEPETDAQIKDYILNNGKPVSSGKSLEKALEGAALN